MLSKEEECFLLKVDLNISHYRKLSGYTQEESAEASGLSLSLIHIYGKLGQPGL